MRIGEVVESAIWLSGEETAEDRRRFETDVCAAIDILCNDMGFLHGPVTFIEKRPGDDRVPAVPDHIQGPRVRLLVAEAELTTRKPESKPDSFVANLDRQDAIRLRHLTRRAQAKHMPDRKLTDAECDKIIEQYGPEAALDTLRRATRH